MARGNVRVNIQGDASHLEQETRRADRALSRLNKSGGKAMKGLKMGAVGAGAAVGGGLVMGLGKAAKAAIEAEKSQAKLQAQLKALGIDYGKNAKQIDKVIKAQSKLSGLDDEDLQDSFTNIVRVTGDVNEALKLNALAADLSRAKNIDVAKAGDMVAKMAGGNTNALKKYGVVVKDGATVQEALAAAQDKYGGQAEAYGKTTAGAMDRAAVASEGLGESVGAKMAPLVAKGADALVSVVGAVERAWPKITKTFNTVKDAVGVAFGAVRKFVTDFVTKNREDIDSFVQAAKNVFNGLKTFFLEVWLPTIKKMLPAFKQIFEGLIRIVRGVIRIVTGILTLDFGKAWDGLKDIASGALKALTGVLKAAWQPIKKGAQLVGQGILAGLEAGLKGLLGIGRGVINTLIDLMNKGIGVINRMTPGAIKVAGETIVPAIPDIPKIPRMGGERFDPKPSGDPKGSEKVKARASAKRGSMGLAEVLSKRFGLRFTSGYRDPSRNAAAGGVPNSWHTRGSASNPGAIDMVGSPQAMQDAAAWVRANVPGLDEVLVHDAGSGLHLHVGGTGVMNYSGAAAASKKATAKKKPKRVGGVLKAGAGLIASAGGGTGSVSGAAAANWITPAAASDPESVDGGSDPGLQASIDALTAQLARNEQIHAHQLEAANQQIANEKRLNAVLQANGNQWMLGLYEVLNRRFGVNMHGSRVIAAAPGQVARY